MSIIQGTIIKLDFDIDIPKKSGGSYKGFRLVYTDSTGRVVTLEKPIQVLKFNRTLDKQIKSLSVGDQFTLLQEKNEGGFWEPKSIEKGSQEPSPALHQQEEKSYSKPPTPPQSIYGNRDYETKEERNNRQLYIIRQSSLAQAVNFCGIDSDIHKTNTYERNIHEVMNVANLFTNWVLTGEYSVGGEIPKDSLEKEFDATGDVPY